MTGYLSVIPALFGSLGFLLFFNSDRRHMLMGSLNGALGWFVFLLVKNLGGDLFVCSLVGTLIATVASEILARTAKAPSTIYYISGIIPMVPGSNLYYMVEGFINGNKEQALFQGSALLWTILGMAVGVSAVLGILWTVRKIRQSRQG